MKVKRFFAKNMQAALKQVKEEMGADAVILSNRKVDGGVEIVTAIDYREDEARQQVLDRTASDKAVPLNLSSGKVAGMAAQQHVALMGEIEKSRSRIGQVRGKPSADEEDVWDREFAAEYQQKPKAKSVSRSVESDDWWQGAGKGSASVAQQDTKVVAGGSQSPELLAEMKAEILQLKSLLSDKMKDTARKTSAVYQSLQTKLNVMGLEAKWQEALLDSILEESDEKNAWRKLLGGMASEIGVAHSELIERGGRVAFLGPTGVGKTTTIGKLATRYVLKNGSEGIALVTTDRYRIAAHEQLLVFGRILDIPVYVVHEGQSLNEVLAKLKDKHLVMIDTAGLNQNHDDWKDQIKVFSNSAVPLDFYLVVPAISQSQIMKSCYHAYKEVGLTGCIITKVDEALSLGEVISFVAGTGLTIAYIADGQKIPDDIHPGNASMLVGRAVTLANEFSGMQRLSG